MEQILTYQNPQCEAEQHLPTKGAKAPSQLGPLIINLLCKECGKPIENAKSLRKQFCDDCIKKHREERLKKWKEKHPEKERIYQQRKRFKKVRAEGKIYKPYVLHCVDCGTDISNRPHSLFCKKCLTVRKKLYNKKRNKKRDWQQYYREKKKEEEPDKRHPFEINHCLLCGNDIIHRGSGAIYCEECAVEIRLYRDWYHAEVIEKRSIIKKSLINNCICCGQDISSYSSQKLLCNHCEKSNYNFYNLGSSHIGPRMKKKNFRVPDFKTELKVVEQECKRLGISISKKGVDVSVVDAPKIQHNLSPKQLRSLYVNHKKRRIQELRDRRKKHRKMVNFNVRK